MLDKSVEFKSIIMRLDNNQEESAGENIAENGLPPGYTFKFFEPDDVKHWSRIETSVLEFETEQAAESYFMMSYMPHIRQLEKRCLFALNPDGLPVATATAWYADSELGHQASLHWVAVCPEYQGKGLGKSVTRKALSVFQSLEPGAPIWLHTQTWSHVAVRMYHSLGFNVARTDRLANMNTRSGIIKIYENPFDEAMRLLTTVTDAEFVRKLIETAV